MVIEPEPWCIQGDYWNQPIGITWYEWDTGEFWMGHTVYTQLDGGIRGGGQHSNEKSEVTINPTIYNSTDRVWTLTVDWVVPNNK